MSGLTQELSELKPRPPSNASGPRGEIQTGDMSNRAEYQGRRRSTVSFHGLKAGMDAAAAGQGAGHLASVTSGSLPARGSTASREFNIGLTRSSPGGAAALPARGSTASCESNTSLTRSSPGGAAALPARGGTASRESDTDLTRGSRDYDTGLTTGIHDSGTDLPTGIHDSDTDLRTGYRDSETDLTMGSRDSSDTGLTPRQGITDFLESALPNIQLRNAASDHVLTSSPMNEAPPGRGPLSKLIGSPSEPVGSPRTESSLEGAQWTDTAAYERTTKPEGAEEAAAGTTFELKPAPAKLDGVEGASP
eukprot:gene17209-23529_t